MAPQQVNLIDQADAEHRDHALEQEIKPTQPILILSRNSPA